MERKYATILVAIFAALTFNTCQSGLFSTRLDEGVIDFAVSYPYLDKDNFLLDFLPTSMSLQFKDNVMTSELSSGLGMFKTNFINNSNELVLNHMVKLVNQKIYSRFDSNTIEEVLADYPVYTIIKQPGTEMIAGFLCNKALIIYDEIDTREFYIYYTDQIEFNNPNWSTPFRGIDGMLMAYEVKQFNVTTRMVAEEVRETKVEPEIFEVPADYEEVPFSTIKNQISEIFDAFAD